MHTCPSMREKPSCHQRGLAEGVIVMHDSTENAPDGIHVPRWVEIRSGAPHARKRHARTSEGLVYLVESWRVIYHRITACRRSFCYSDDDDKRTCGLQAGGVAVSCLECLTTLDNSYSLYCEGGEQGQAAGVFSTTCNNNKEDM